MRDQPILDAIRQAFLAQLAIDAGAWEAARESVAGARAAGSEGEAPSNPWLFTVDAVTAALATHDGDRTLAKAAVDRAAPVLADPPWQGPRTQAWALMDLVDAQVFLWRLPQAEQLLEQAASVLAGLDRAEALRARLRAQGSALRPLLDAHPVPSALTPGEKRVLALLPSHRSLVEVAAELELSRNTVKHHVNAMYRKLGAHDRQQVVDFAERLGFLS